MELTRVSKRHGAIGAKGSFEKIMSNVNLTDGISKRGYPGMRTRFNFTIVELLVVITIISILMAMLLPGLAMARQKALDISCKGNLKQIGAAALTYCDDYNGYVMPSDFIYNGSSHCSWIDYMYNVSLNSKDVFKCPIAKGYFNPYGSPPASFGNTSLSQASYVMNVIKKGNWSGAPISSNPSTSCGWGTDSNSPVSIKRASDISSKIFIVDGYVNPAGSAISSIDALGILDYNETDHGPIATRDVADHHFKRSNAVFGDGHVEDLKDSVPDQWVVFDNQ